MIELAGREHDWASYDSLWVLMNRAGAGSRTLPFTPRVVRAAAQRDEAALRALVTAAAREPDGYAVFALVAMADDPVASRAVAESMLSRSMDPGQRMWIEGTLGATELAAGRWRAAARVLERARDDAARAGMAYEGERLLWTTAACAALPSLPVPQADVAALRDAIEQWNTDVPPPNTPPSPLLPLRPHLRRYLLGVLEARLGADESAARHADALERLPVGAADRTTTDLLSGVLRASIAARRGEHARVLDLLQRPRAQLPMSHQGIRFVDIHGRWLRAEALRALGRDAEASQWYRALVQGEEYGGAPELALMGPALLRRAELHERRGDMVAARELYARFADLWADADPEARALARSAAQRASSLRDAPP